MAQWISIEEAAAKYGFETEYIWVLIEIREIIVTTKELTSTSSTMKVFRILSTGIKRGLH